MYKFNKDMIYENDPTAERNLSGYVDYYKIKYDICKKINPKIIAEIGVRAGYSAYYFLQACPNAEYYGFDANNGTHGGQGGEDGRYLEHAKKILVEHNTSFNVVDTQKVNSLPVKNVDLFHVDGDHTYKGVQHDLDLAAQCISENGYILVDDIDYIDSVKGGVYKWLENNNEYQYEYIKSFRGEILISKK